MESLLKKLNTLESLNTSTIDDATLVLNKFKIKRPGVAIIKQICTMLSRAKLNSNNTRKLDYCLTITFLALQSLNSGSKWQNVKLEQERSACNVLSRLLEMDSVSVF
jgi:hypothetical protein